MTQAAIRIGTRGSPLAVAQAEETRRRLCQAHADLQPDQVEIRIIKTTGDKLRDRSLAEAGGKGLFVKEIEAALMEGEVDIAVHSMKDVPTELPPGLAFTAYLPRANPCDAFISSIARHPRDLPAGAVVGSASLRRQAQMLHRYPEVKVTLLRGNVDTRLAKIRDGIIDATFLAYAGLQRLGLTEHAATVMDTDDMLPAIAQGVIGVEQREDDGRIRDLLAPINDRVTEICVSAERAFLGNLDGSCRTPIAGLATLEEGPKVAFRGEILRPDGSEVIAASRIGGTADAVRLGTDAGAEVRAKAPSDFFHLDG